MRLAARSPRCRRGREQRGARIGLQERRKMHPLDFASPEMRMLWASVLLGLVQLMIAFIFSIAARGMPWALAARDEAGAPVGRIGARLERAYRNYLETFPIFATLVLIANGMDRHSAGTVLGAQLYLY